ncbi:MAG: sugar phosphate isomerase/epimerase [Anaerolineae bacterium]|nr:sugar phosphate isomerase/epimerase [Anaerolineae bacterium]
MTEMPFKYCLNTSTIRGQGLSLVDMVDVVAAAGYDGIEPWVRELDAYVAAGGDLARFGAYVAAAGLEIPNVIGFFEWAVDEEERRRAAMAEARRCIKICAEIGCPRVAAPPSGITKSAVPLPALAERYAALLSLGEQMGVVPMVEFWGISQTLSTLGEAVYVAMESGHREACVLADVFHMYKAGSPHNGLRLVGPETLGLVHMNDYPGAPGREEVTDGDRVYPGDGIAPTVLILRDLAAAGYRGHLSLELFNEHYWAQPAQTVARTGLQKMQLLVAEVLA